MCYLSYKIFLQQIFLSLSLHTHTHSFFNSPSLSLTLSLFCSSLSLSPSLSLPLSLCLSLSLSLCLSLPSFSLSQMRAVQPYQLLVDWKSKILSLELEIPHQPKSQLSGNRFNYHEHLILFLSILIFQ